VHDQLIIFYRINIRIIFTGQEAPEVK